MGAVLRKQALSNIFVRIDVQCSPPPTTFQYIPAPMLCLLSNRYADAEECCSLSLLLDENNAKAYLMRAKARSKLGKLELAIEGIDDNNFVINYIDMQPRQYN